MCPIIAIIIFVHVPNCFGYVMVIIADRELWDMALPCSEACSRLSRSSRGLRNKEMSAQEGPQNGKKAPDVRGAWLEHKRLMHSHSRAPFKAHSANWSGRRRTRVRRGSDDSTEDDVPASRKPEKDEARKASSLRFPFRYSLPPVRSSGTWREVPPKPPHSSGLWRRVSEVRLRPCPLILVELSGKRTLRS
jgi:hypothetical protein